MTVDKLLLPPTDGNYLFFDWLQKRKGIKDVELKPDVLEEIAHIINSRLPPEGHMDVDKFKKNGEFKLGSKVALNDLLNQARSYFFSHVSKYVSELGIHKNHLILVCIFKYFLEVADERKEFFRQKTVTFKQGSQILDHAEKMLNVILLPEKRLTLKLVKDDIDDFAKRQTDAEKENLNMKIMKETSPDELFELFVKNIQQ